VTSSKTALGSRKSCPTILFGYELLEVIGAGAGSTLYAASDPETGQLYALKYVRVKHEKDIRFVEQLRGEFEIGQQFTHPGLRRSIDLKEQRTGLLRKTLVDAALVLELFDGTPIDQAPPTDLASALARFAAAAQALAALHRGGIVHCDLKPSNILVAADGTVKVIDFGQACPTGTIKPRVQGTADYIAPEQVKREPVTPRTDVYNFGATLYRVLTGRSLPTLFTAGMADNSFLLADTIPAPRDLDPRIPSPLSNLVMECVRTNPAKRPADMNDLALRLEIIRHGLHRAAAAARADALVQPPRSQYRLYDPELLASESAITT
jgi:serine/threonine-protein kinase